MVPTENAPLLQPNNGDLPPQQKNLAVKPQCDICWRVFTRKDNLSRHRKIHFVKRHQSPTPMECSTTVIKKEDKTEEFDKGLLAESREVLKIYKLLQRMKQSKNDELCKLCGLLK